MVIFKKKLLSTLTDRLLMIASLECLASHRKVREIAVFLSFSLGLFYENIILGKIMIRVIKN